MNGPIVPSYVNAKSTGALSYNSEHQSCDFQELDQRMNAWRLLDDNDLVTVSQDRERHKPTKCLSAYFMTYPQMILLLFYWIANQSSYIPSLLIFLFLMELLYATYTMRILQRSRLILPVYYLSEEFKASLESFWKPLPMCILVEMLLLVGGIGPTFGTSILPDLLTS